MAAADVDRDGDTDLFVGTLADARAYGIPQTSTLLLNNGKGIFSIASDDKVALKDIGMVTSAAFSDLNSDGWMDLVVAGEWMPLTIFMNKNGSFSRQAIPHSTGWWQTVTMDDVNGDGHPDILGGNWGWNNKFCSNKDGKVGLYVSDFDKNGRTDQLLCYLEKGKEFPFLAKDEMERALPVLRKHYLLYSEYAGLTMQDAFYGFVDNMEPLKAERLGSAVCLGNGKGEFEIRDLPAELQLAPIFSFRKTNVANDQSFFLAGGNFFDVIPYEGRYDAQSLVLFSIDKNNSVKVFRDSTLNQQAEQVRDLKWLNTNRGPVIVVASNNSKLAFLRPTFLSNPVKP